MVWYSLLILFNNVFLRWNIIKCQHIKGGNYKCSAKVVLTTIKYINIYRWCIWGINNICIFAKSILCHFIYCITFMSGIRNSLIYWTRGEGWSIPSFWSKFKNLLPSLWELSLWDLGVHVNCINCIKQVKMMVLHFILY